ncbi:hypothetical protein JB92DRAFT_3028555 [Gautieria morchelliformis]|nr:hypothetical protein JB92DRAFT_3028555 [Gautieria morchelliformis]
MLSLAEGVLHPGCSAYLIDMVTALPFIIIGLAKDEQRSTSNSYPSKFAMAPFSPSQRLDITFHDAATLGARLKIIGKSTTHSGSSLIVRCEIWDTGEERLVASAMHCKVMPSKKPPSATLIKL